MSGTPMPAFVADQGFDDAPALDLILVPGGVGTISELENHRMLDFLRRRSNSARITMSVCSGSALLAKAELLDGRRATSNKQVFNLAASRSDRVEWVEEARRVDAGEFVTSSGISAGIDMALAVIARLVNAQAAERIATATEYTWHRDVGVDPFAQHLNTIQPG